MGDKNIERLVKTMPAPTFDNAVTASAGITATTGGVTATAGGVTATAGGVTATAGNITATAGNLVATAGDVIITAPTTPASASATGTIGTIAWDTSFLYVCVATDTWKRVGIATW